MLFYLVRCAQMNYKTDKQINLSVTTDKQINLSVKTDKQLNLSVKTDKCKQPRCNS